jgi:hypothetical protein
LISVLDFFLNAGITESASANQHSKIPRGFNRKRKLQQCPRSHSSTAIKDQLQQIMEIVLSIPSAKEALHQLLNQKPIPLHALTGGGGLYALEDERGIVRYIGETGSLFLTRIHQYHSGGDDNSHKFSTVFNAGRLWHMSSVDVNPIKRTHYVPSDGRISKELRPLFVRSLCRARTINLPSLTKPGRIALEKELLAVAPTENKLWNDRRLLTAYEPEGDLDAFLEKLSWPDAKIAAIERQKARWDAINPADRVVMRRSKS